MVFRAEEQSENMWTSEMVGWFGTNSDANFSPCASACISASYEESLRPSRIDLEYTRFPRYMPTTPYPALLLGILDPSVYISRVWGFEDPFNRERFIPGK